MTRILVLLFAALVAAPCAAVSGSRLIGGDAGTPVPQLAAFAPWAIVGWLLVLVLLLAARWWWIAAVVLVLLAVQVTWVYPTRGAQAAAGDRPEIGRASCRERVYISVVAGCFRTKGTTVKKESSRYVVSGTTLRTIE